LGQAAFSVRHLVRADGPLLRDLRLLALREAPDQFGESVESALSRSDQEWLDSAEAAYVAEADEQPVGMVFAFPDPSERATGRLGGVWVKPTARNAGVGLALVEAGKAWALAHGMCRVRLWVVPDTAAERLYRRAGFVPTGVQKPFLGHVSRVVIEMQLELAAAGAPSA